MTFMNLVKSGAEGFTQYGKFIGEGKRNGIKVYEQFSAKGKRILNSVSKEGELIKTLEKDRFTTTINKTQTGENIINSRVREYMDDSRTYGVRYVNQKIYPQNSPSGIKEEMLIRTYRGKELGTYHLGGKNKEDIVELMRNEARKDVRVSQEMADGSSLSLTKDIKKNIAKIEATGDYKLAPDVVIPNGTSSYSICNDALSPLDATNTVEKNLAQALFDAIKKL